MMTHASVNPGSIEPVQYAAHDLPISSPTGASTVAPPSVASLTITDTPAAANDDEAAAPDPVRNPLWVIAIAMACLFAVMAAVMSVG
jgi:hypothetical protein